MSLADTRTNGYTERDPNDSFGTMPGIAADLANRDPNAEPRFFARL